MPNGLATSEAERTLDEKQAQELARKVRTARFNLDDFLSQLREIKKK